MNLKTHHVLLGYSKQMNQQTDSYTDEDGIGDADGFIKFHNLFPNPVCYLIHV